MPRLALTAAVVLAASTFAIAQTEPAKIAKPTTQPEPAPITLHVGDKAPPLSIGEWVKGTPTTGFEKGRVYIVEFWATWCGPCIASMPHLCAIQKEYGDRVQVIAVTKEDPNNSLEKVKTFVTDKGDGMAYTVAWDKDKETNAAYMKAAGRGGIPCSFVVDSSGRVAYIGHPMWLDMPLEKITKGTWDYKEGMAAVAAAEEKLSAVSKSAAKDPAAALAQLRDLEKEYPAVGDVMGSMKFSLLVKDGSPEARKECRSLADAAIAKKDSTKLVSIARAITAPTVKDGDLDLALTAATKAVEFTEEKNPAMLEALARVYFVKGDAKSAITWQKKAIAAAPDTTADARKKAMEKTLAEYEGKS